jgi:hypothetical protein
MIFFRASNDSRIFSQARSSLQKLKLASPVFKRRLMWACDYDQLFEGVGEITAERELLERTLKSGRSLVVAPGGAGKTELLKRLALGAVKKDVLPILIRLGAWTKADYERWEEWTSVSVADGAAFLLERFALPHISISALDAISPDIKKLILVDGLNEVRTEVGTEILIALDRLCRDQILTSLCVTDRLVRRDLPYRERWMLAILLPLEMKDVPTRVGRKVQGGDIPPILPIQLDALSKASAKSDEPSDISDFISGEFSFLNSSESERLARAAFESYRTNRSRKFELRNFEELAGKATIRTLIDLGKIVSLDDTVGSFDHHLFHDFLAAKHVASLPPETWTPSIFNALTLDGSSFDTVPFVLTAIAPGLEERYLRALYDWNLYAAGYALTKLPRALAATTLDIQVVISAMLAEKSYPAI